ncbi:MAG TPA: serine hydrolase domain-containing protein [Anaerolineae bacterium]|nr:serine hydrolase domain-containing protein [Anaerolineae bacterium]
MRRIKQGSRRGVILGGIVLGLLVLVALALALGSPRAAKLGIRSCCLEGDWPHVRVGSCAAPTTAAPAVGALPTPVPATGTESPGAAASTQASTLTPPAPTAQPEPSPSPESSPSKPAAGADTAADQIATGLQELAAEGGFSGVVLIAKEGAPVLTQAHGLADRDLGTPNQMDTKFNLGSMDKMFTAVAILQLAEQGKVSLQGTIAESVPDYPNQQVARSVTIHQLLTHTSGMGDYFESQRFEELRTQLRSVEDYLALFADAPLEFKPGEQVRYSNSGYVVLGLIIEKVTGQSYYDYVRQNVFEPSGMADTAAYELDGHVPNVARGYTRFDAQYNETGEVRDNSSLLPMRGGPAGGGYSTVGDLLRFSNALLAHELLSPESTELALAPKVRLGEKAQYAYGFMNRGSETQRIVGHGGGAPGVCSMLNVFLDQRYTTVILTNGDEDCLAAYEMVKEALLPETEAF